MPTAQVSRTAGLRYLCAMTTTVVFDQDKVLLNGNATTLYLLVERAPDTRTWHWTGPFLSPANLPG